MDKIKYQHLREFLKQSSKDNSFKVELTSHLAVRYSYYYKLKLEATNLLSTIEILLTFEENKALLDLLPFNSNQKMLIRQNLWYAIIINYGRVFASKSEDEALVRHIKLQSKDCYKKATNSQLIMHEYIIEIRNKLVAHGTQNNQEAVIPYFYIHFISNNQIFEGHLAIEVIGTISFSAKELRVFNELVIQLLEFINYKIDQFRDKLENEINEKPIQYWFEKTNA